MHNSYLKQKECRTGAKIDRHVVEWNKLTDYKQILTSVIDWFFVMVKVL